MSHNYGGCYLIYKIGEGNFRFIIIVIALISYIIMGAGIFQAIERENELKCREEYASTKLSFLSKYPDINETDLAALLDAHQGAAAKGHLETSRERWDFYGSFYFVCTIVFTIGFGMTTPLTLVGKVVCILYGFFGCVLSVLTFNLFLERIIILWTELIKMVSRVVSRLRSSVGKNKVAALDSSLEDDSQEWKPSILKLIVLLSLTLLTISLPMTTMLMYLEGWSFIDSFYFCFVTFTTIGFGDFVSHQQKDNYGIDNADAYSVFNIILIMIGCSCMYSLLNVISILVKEKLMSFMQFLTRKLTVCYYDPNLEVIAERGRRRHATFDLTAQLGKASETEYVAQREAWSRYSSRQSQKQYQQNINNIALEAGDHDAISEKWAGDHPVFSVENASNTTQDTCDTVSHSNLQTGHLELPRKSIHSIFVDERQDRQTEKPTLNRIDTSKSIDLRRSLHRRDTCIDLAHLNELSMSMRSRPRSKTSYASKVGGMNVVAVTLQEVISPDSSDSEPE